MNHHDVFFKQMMGQPAVVHQFLGLCVPQPIQDQVDLQRYRRLSGAFADVGGREHFSELVLQVPTRTGGELGIFVLVELKSEPEPRSPFQLLGYMTHLWDRAAQAGQPCQAILPIVVYHGPRPWLSPEQFQDSVVMLPGMEGYTPSFRYVLVDLARLDVARATQPGVLQSGLLAMKHIYQDALGGQLHAIYRSLASSTGVSFVRELTLYLMRAGRGVSKDELIHTASQTLPPEGAKEVTSIAEKVYAEGRVEGRVEGLIEATLSYVRSGLITKAQAAQQIDAQVQAGRLSEADAEKAKCLIAEV